MSLFDETLSELLLSRYCHSVLAEVREDPDKLKLLLAKLFETLHPGEYQLTKHADTVVHELIVLFGELLLQTVRPRQQQILTELDSLDAAQRRTETPEQFLQKEIQQLPHAGWALPLLRPTAAGLAAGWLQGLVDSSMSRLAIVELLSEINWGSLLTGLDGEAIRVQLLMPLQKLLELNQDPKADVAGKVARVALAISHASARRTFQALSVLTRGVWPTPVTTSPVFQHFQFEGAGHLSEIFAELYHVPGANLQTFTTMDNSYAPFLTLQAPAGASRTFCQVHASARGPD